MKLLLKLLRQNINAWQISGFLIVNLLGGIIVLSGIQGYRDFNSFSSSGDQVLSSGYLVITKPVTTLGTLTSAMGAHPSFSEAEIEDLRKLPSVTSVGEFLSAMFEVKASFAIGQARMSSDIFLEAVPDEYIKNDYNSVGGVQYPWRATLQGDTVPVIIPRNYLNLYNYGYATSNGMPQISDELLATFPLQLHFVTEQGRVTYEAVVCGLTNKLNTILVPWNFMQEANSAFMPGSEQKPSRLILVTDATDLDESLLQYIKDKGYVIEGDSSHVRLQSFVSGIIMVVIGIGFLFSFLAFCLLIISIMLLIEKNKEKIVNLYSIGYSVESIARVYQFLSLVVDSIVWLFAALLSTVVYPVFTAMLQTTSPAFTPVSLWWLWAMALFFALGFATMHWLVVHYNVKRHCKCNN